MQKQKGFISPLLAIGVVLIGVFVLAIVFGPKMVKNFGILSSRKSGQESEAAGKGLAKGKLKKSSPTPAATSSASPVVSLSPSPLPSPSSSPSGLPTVFRQPQGKYTITLPAGWVVNDPVATSTYSTTKFTSSIGYIAVTFGTGKDPIGGCSETSTIYLADRTISVCLLLQKDGTQLLTRGYTKDSVGIDFTIEAYINNPNAQNRDPILAVIKTLDIN